MIDGYDSVERIGRGGLGDVYRARRVSTGATVAIKVLRDVSDESVAWHRTRRELTALVSLAGHANVVQLLEVLDLPDGPALVMEYAPGGSIADVMSRRDEPLTVGETVLVGRQAANALAAAHRQGIVHRDVKPQNLLVDAYGQVKLCDFGIAAMLRSDEFATRTNSISLRYASPEDLDEEPDVGPAADIYSLGATMLHLSRGAPPTMKERLAEWVPPPSTDPDLAALDRVVARCLHPDPAQRPEAVDVRDELERLGWSLDERNGARPPDGDTGTGTPIQVERLVDPTRMRPRPATEPAPEPPDPTPTRRRTWPVAIAGLATVAVVGAAAVVGSLGTDGDDPARFTSVARPGDLPDLASLDWPLGEAGTCLVQIDDRLADIDCGEPHDLQQVGGGVLDDARDGFDAERVRAAVGRSCDEQAAATLGTAPGELGLDAPFVTPSAATWEVGDRSYGCFVAVAGRRIVGDVTATG